MPRIITKIEATLLETYTSDLYYISSVSGEIQFEDYIELNTLIAYLQNFTKVDYLEKLDKPVNFGLQNQYNLPTTILEASAPFTTYQERIYIRTENRAVRNKDMLNVNMSSDFCVFESPQFDLSGGTKIQCANVTCYLTGYSLNNMLTASTATCLSGLSSNICLTATTWQTKIYENTSIAYSADFYTTSITGDTPSDTLFINSVSGALSTLGYMYTQTGTTFEIEKKGNVNQLQIDVCVIFKIKPSEYFCPSGFTATPANDACKKIEISAATYNGSGTTIVAGNKNATNYSIFGTYFYPDISTLSSFPLYYVGNFSNLVNQSVATISPLDINTSSAFWASLGSTANGRLNNAGLFPDTTQYLGFTKCLDILETKTYYVGLAADNFCKFYINGNLIVDFNNTAQDNFRKWSVFPITLYSGKNIIEMYGKNDSGNAAFAAEIYNPIDYTTLVNATDSGATQANVIFSTIEFIGQTWELGDTIGYSCTGGYSLDNCSGYQCTKITVSAITAVTCSASCSGTCTTVCDDSFPYIDNSSAGVYQFDSLSSTTVDLLFNFTANTSVFTAQNATFRYEIYKYNPTLNVFGVPSVYASETINYSAFSATNVYEASIPLSGLSLDGDYLVKGYYLGYVCTDFLYRLGKTIDTSIYSSGSEYQLYDKNTDFYFVAINKADNPIFLQTGSGTGTTGTTSVIPLYQDVILLDQDSGSTYTRTGETFTLANEYIGDLIVTLNGLCLSETVDYTLNGRVLTFLGEVQSGDVVTIIYTRNSSLNLINDTIEINGTIPSGATNTQGTNKYFYNTTTGKYEAYLNNTPIDGSEIIVILNGVVLARNVDFYQSTSNKKRIIFNGILLVNDIISIIYYPTASVINGVSNNSNLISWYIPTVPQANNGNFYLEYSSGSTFGVTTISDTVPYSSGVTTYSGILTLTGTVGENYYYRVRNVKEYASICGDLITSTGYSDTVQVVLQTNSINSY